MGKMLREKIVKELTERYRDTEHCVFMDFTGLDAETMVQFREKLSDNGLEIFIVKNSLLKLAMEEVGLPYEEKLFERPTAVVSGSDDPVLICKIITDWKKKADKAQIKGGLLDKGLLNREQVLELSRLPSREVLLSEILGLFVAPMSNMANLFNNTIGQFANLLNNHIEKMEKEAS